jgi:riboflavin biosynthesis pyrimidine reductase
MKPADMRVFHACRGSDPACDQGAGEITGMAERTAGLMALKLADKVRNPAAIIGRTAGRLPKKKTLTTRSREPVAIVDEEAEDVGDRVRDFHSVLKDKGPEQLYTYEDFKAL